MLTGVRRALLLLIAFAFLGGVTGQLARSAGQVAPAAVAAMPCDMKMPGMGHAAAGPMMPCKNMNCDCMKQMGVAAIDVPVRLSGIEPAIPVAQVDYWPGQSGLTGFIASPEHLPPRAI